MAQVTGYSVRQRRHEYTTKQLGTWGEYIILEYHKNIMRVKMSMQQLMCHINIADISTWNKYMFFCTLPHLDR